MGETVAAATGATARLDAIILATGPSRIRLITRTGRRITAPVSSWDRIWHLVHAAPATRRDCEREGCTQEAFFRYHAAAGLVAWVCEDHLPHGMLARFPGDRDEPETNLICVLCGGSVTQGAVLLLSERATVSHHCSRCMARWCPLISRGLGDDGELLARDIYALRTLEGMSFVEVRMGYRSYRDLCRALGVGILQHVAGLPIIHDRRLEDQLALAIEHRPEMTDRPETNDFVDGLKYAIEAVTLSRQGAEPLKAEEALSEPIFTLENAPCVEGERWAHRSNDDVIVTIVKVQLQLCLVTVEERASSIRHDMTLHELTRFYRRLNIRTCWEILESEDEDTPT